MKDIVKSEDKELFVTLKDISRFSGVEEKSIKRLLTNNEDSFEELGLKVKESKAILNRLAELKLNEEQTTFLMILMRNNPTIVKFKLELVKQFMQIKRQLHLSNENKVSSLTETYKHQLEQKDKTIEETKRKAYAHSREGNYQCVTNIIRDTNADISSATFNKILLEKKYLDQKEVTVKKYISNNKESITSLDGNILVHYDTAIAILKHFEIEFTEDEQMKMEF